MLLEEKLSQKEGLIWKCESIENSKHAGKFKPILIVEIKNIIL